MTVGGGIEWGSAPQWISGMVALIAFLISVRAMSSKASDDKIDKVEQALLAKIGEVKSAVDGLDKREREEGARIFERLDSSETRVAKLEVEIEHMPTKDALHDLDVKITKQSAMLESMLAIVDRLQEHILSREGM